MGSILSSQKTPTWSDEGASALRPTVAGNSADGGGADGGHLGRGRMEDPKKLETPKKGDATARPFIFSEGLPPVAAKLVARILRGDFVDMAELLRDTLEVQQMGALQ